MSDRWGARRRAVRRLGALVVGAALPLAGAGPAGANHAQPSPDITKMDYTPMGAFKHGDALPSTADPPKFTGDGIYNPSGKWVAYDSNVFETLNFPQRQAGDTSASDPPGNGGMPHGFCPLENGHPPWGLCANHQLEWLDYYEKTMKAILGDFGVVVHRYPFESPGSGTRGALFSTAPGSSYNISAEVPGVDHPEESVIVSGHYDVTDSAPAPAWDSAEGHAEVIRMAKIMADYWRATGTRPSATVKFIPWDQEESGTLGSQDFVENNIPPGHESKIRGYFNVDPCAGAYPAFYHGNPGYNVPMQLQLANPIEQTEPDTIERFVKFNVRAEEIVEEVMTHLDDTVETTAGPQEVFVSDAEADQQGVPSQRGEVVTALGGLLLFTSDYANFQGIGVPFMNLSPDMFGPHADAESSLRASPEGVSILHTPRDNLTSLNLLTGPDQSGLTASDGWAKGMEFCAQLESWYMLQPEMGGAQRANDTDPVAYFVALPNEATERRPVHFDARGSYQYSQVAGRSYVPESQLSFTWDFGDGESGTGRRVDHVYTAIGRYNAKLTVRNTRTGKRDTMEIPIEVVGSRFDPPVLTTPPATDDDGTFDLSWTFNSTRSGFQHFAIEESRDYVGLVKDDAEGELERLWEAGPSPTPGVIHPWQKSNSAQPKLFGNKRHSGESSYWTGAFPTSVPAGTNLDSTLTLKQPIRIPTRGDPTLSYYSLFASEPDDQGFVEAAIDDGNPSTPLDWDSIDRTQGAFAPDDRLERVFEELGVRNASLVRYKGKSILLRFRYHLGSSEANRNQPVGWYIDDIKLDAGTFRSIGTSTTTKFQVFGKTKGDYGYRVRGVYTDGVETAPSDVGSVKVTVGAPLKRVACRAGTGFRSVRVTPSGGGLRFSVSPRVRRRYSVDILQASQGKRAIAPRRVARFRNKRGSFRWNGRARGKRLSSGFYVTRVSMSLARRRVDDRRFALRLARGRFSRRPAHHRRGTCATLGGFGLSSPVFGGSSKRSLQISFLLLGEAEVGIVVRRGRRVIRSYRPELRAPGAYRVALAPDGLAAGDYTVEIEVAAGERTTKARLTARRI